MKLEYIKQAIGNKDLTITREDTKQAVSTLHIGNYIKLFAYHYLEDVFQMEMVAHMNIDDEQHYQDIAKLMDISLNMLSDFTAEQRISIYDFINVGSIDTKKLDLNGIKVNYELQKGYLKFSVFET